MPGQLSVDELTALLAELGEQLQSIRTVEDRRNYVLKLLRIGKRRMEIFNLVGPACGISIKTLDEDISKCKKWELDYAKGLNREKAMAEALGTNAEIRRRAFDKGDLAVANQALQHFSRLTKLEDPLAADAGAEGAQTRFVLLPVAQTEAIWLQRHQPGSTSKAPQGGSPTPSPTSKPPAKPGPKSAPLKLKRKKSPGSPTPAPKPR